MSKDNTKVLEEYAPVYSNPLDYHSGSIASHTPPPTSTYKTDNLNKLNEYTRPGKYAIHATKPLITQDDLGLAYSPGVALPCYEIHRDVNETYKYTSRGNTVAVVSNGTAILGLGNLGAAASSPVMEGKAVLFKKFANIDSVPIVIDENDPDKLIDIITSLRFNFGGINLEDIKAPECFYIEKKLKERLDIPVFHDDQHGTAVVVLAGLINALKLANKSIRDIKVVINGAGAAGIACASLLIHMGLNRYNLILCDSSGVIHEGRLNEINEWKKEYATKDRILTLKDAVIDSDVFIGLSVKNALSPNMLRSMSKNPIVFAMANPDPEITPYDAKKTREDVIIATGRSDYPNQINNVIGFPYIFRGALDAKASVINMQMCEAAIHAIANITTLDVPQNIKDIYNNQSLKYGRDYIIPTPFDKRLFETVPKAVTKAALDSKAVLKL